MALKHLQKLLLFALFVACASAEEDCKHKICVGVEEGYFLDDPSNCSTFFVCVNGRAVLGACPDGFYFHPSLQKCDVNFQVPCQPGEEIELECIEEEGPPPPPEEEPPFTCGTTDTYVMQHPTNCSKYILCFHGVAHVRPCASELEWDVAIEQCNTPDLAQCLPSECPFQDDPNQPVFLYNDNQCERFALCVNGLPQWRSCASGFHWDRVNQWCTTPQKAGCEEWTEPPVDEIECHDDSPLRNPHPTVCNLYFLCIDQESFLRSCASGLIFDYITRSCTNPSDGICYADIGSEPTKVKRNREFDHLCLNGEGSPVREHPDTCLKFIVCDWDTGNAWALPCAPGHVFVRELYACVPGNENTCEPDDH